MKFQPSEESETFAEMNPARPGARAAVRERPRPRPTATATGSGTSRPRPAAVGTAVDRPRPGTGTNRPRPVAQGPMYQIPERRPGMRIGQIRSYSPGQAPEPQFQEVNVYDKPEDQTDVATDSGGGATGSTGTTGATGSTGTGTTGTTGSGATGTTGSGATGTVGSGATGTQTFEYPGQVPYIQDHNYYQPPVQIQEPVQQVAEQSIFTTRNMVIAAVVAGAAVAGWMWFKSKK